MAKTAKKPAKTRDLFDLPEPAPRRVTGRRATGKAGSPAEAGYTAKHIEVLEGLEPVRRRPGMYIGGTDEKALHHLFAEVIDNAMDEALAGHASFIEVKMEADGFVTVTDNGRGIPVDPHHADGRHSPTTGAAAEGQTAEFLEENQGRGRLSGGAARTIRCTPQPRFCGGGGACMRRGCSRSWGRAIAGRPKPVKQRSHRSRRRERELDG